MAYDKNTKLITLDKVVIGDDEFDMTSREVEISSMRDRLVIENFGSTAYYYDLCNKYFNKYYFEVEESFAGKLNKSKRYLFETEEGYSELLSAIGKEIKKNQNKEIVVILCIVIAILLLIFKYWYVIIPIILLFSMKSIFDKKVDGGSWLLMH